MPPSCAAPASRASKWRRNNAGSSGTGSSTGTTCTAASTGTEAVRWPTQSIASGRFLRRAGQVADRAHRHAQAVGDAGVDVFGRQRRAADINAAARGRKRRGVMLAALQETVVFEFDAEHLRNLRVVEVGIHAAR